MSKSAKKLLSKKGKGAVQTNQIEPDSGIESFGLDNPHFDAEIENPIDPRETEIGDLIVGSAENSRKLDILHGVQSMVGRVLLDVTDPADLTEANALKQYKV